MRESEDELDGLQQLLDRSHAKATEHLRGIINDDRTLRAREIAGLMTGMRVLGLATVTAAGEPRISAVDGHFLHARWVFSTSLTSAKARHMRKRQAVSVAYVEGEDAAVFTHGRVRQLADEDEDFDEVHGYLTEFYGSSPLSWGDTALYSVKSDWMVGYAFKRDELLARRGVAPDPAR